MLKHLFILVAALGLLLGIAVAQGPKPPSGIVTDSPTSVRAVDGDDTCEFIAPTTTDSATIECWVGFVDPADLKLTSSVFLKLNDPVSGSFTSNFHTISWTLERTHVNPANFAFSISLDGGVPVTFNLI
jgi:hypothetical protein